MKMHPKRNRVKIALGALLTAYFLICFLLAYYRNWLLFHDGVDSSSILQSVSLTASGHGLLCLPWLGGSYLGEHFSPILIGLVPFYMLVPHAVTILFVRNVGISLSGWGAFLIARRKFRDPWAAVAAAFIPLFYPSILSQNFNQIEPDQFVLFFIFFAFYYFQVGRFGLFLLFALLSLATKETVAWTIFMCGVYGLITRRGWKWTVVPIGLSVLLLYVHFAYLGPYFLSGRPIPSLRYLSFLGNSGPEMLATLSRDPLILLKRMIRPLQLVNLWLMLVPLGVFLPLIGWPSLIALPNLIVNLLGPFSFTVLGWHYGILVGSFFCIGAIEGIARLAPRLEKHGLGRRSEIFLALAVLACCWASVSSILDLSSWMAYPNHKAQAAVVRMVPPGASVLASSDLILRFCERPEAVPWEKYHDYYSRLAGSRDAMNFDYVVFNMVFFRDDRRMETWLDRFARSPEHEVVFNREGIVVFRKKQ